jgi:hypothetical protein
VDNSPFLAPRSIAGMTDRRPGRPLHEYVEAYQATGSLHAAAAELRCSVQTMREALFVAGFDLSATDTAPPKPSPKKLPRLRCHCCGQVSTTPACPVTGEVIAPAFAEVS